MQIFGNRSGVIAQWISVFVGSIAIWSTWPKSEPGSTPLQGMAAVKPYLLPTSFAFAIVLAAVLHLIASRTGRDNGRTKETAPATDTAPLELMQTHENCERTIRNHESTIRRLEDQNQTQGVQISARNTQIEQLQAQVDELKTSPYEQVHRIADHQAKNIRDFVTVSRVAVWEHNLNDAVPAIKWGFFIENRSLFPISLVEVRNNIFFEATELAERRFEVNNEVEQLSYWRDGGVIFEQRLSGPEAQYIRNTPSGKFRFNRLKVIVAGPNSHPIIEPQELVITDDLETVLDGGVTYKETRGMKRLKDEIASLKQQNEQLQTRTAKASLTFEIDEQRTRVLRCGGSADSYTYQVDVWLQCFKASDSTLAIRAFNATLFSTGEDGEGYCGSQTSTIGYGENGELLDLRRGWVIDKPMTGFRRYNFFFNILDSSASLLSPRDNFF